MSWYKDPVIIIAISLVFSLDQVTKALVRHALSPGIESWGGGTFRIIHTSNTGTAFGLFADQTLFLVLASVVGVAILLVIYRNHPFPSFPLKLSLGMQLGGALGNLVDRLRMGEVTDFIDLSFWPVFNLADASIVIGIIIMASLFLFAGREEKHPPEDEKPPSAGGAPSPLGSRAPFTIAMMKMGASPRGRSLRSSPHGWITWEGSMKPCQKDRSCLEISTAQYVPPTWWRCRMDGAAPAAAPKNGPRTESRSD